MIFYSFLNYFFVLSHAVLILFTLFGWAIRKTRMAHLVLICLTLFSWGVLGIWFGWGYCFWTDWHWKVRSELGIRNMPNSYVKFLLDSVTGINWDPQFVDILTEVCLFLAVALSFYTNFRDFQGRRRRTVANSGDILP